MRLGGHHVPFAGVALFVAETAVLVLCAGAALTIVPHLDATTAVLTALAATVAVQLLFYLRDLYHVAVAHSDASRGSRLLGALGSACAVAAPIALVVPAPARATIVVAVAAAAAGATALRSLAPLASLKRKIVVVGEGRSLEALRKEILESGDDVVVDVLTPRTLDHTLADRARALAAQAIVVACDDRRGLDPAALLACRLAGIEVLEASAWIERTRRKLPVDLLRPGQLIYDDGFFRSRVSDGLRRTLSLAAAITLMVLFAPAAALVALAIRFDSAGPILYRQRRVGRGGRLFTLFKFRTMRDDAEAATGAVWAEARDPRVTRVGQILRRSRLDELPQLANILIGDMDLVGPRPERPEFVATLREQIPFFDLRALVRPGLTGWAQICYRYGASLEDARHKLGFDLYYVKHASPLLDAIVLFHTAKVVLTARGAR
jgi:exopolysaccharide biosynthesis polyprenyl glycosylphosphotransferase